MKTNTQRILLIIAALLTTASMLACGSTLLMSNDELLDALADQPTQTSP